jgi:hypothetical protein
VRIERAAPGRRHLVTQPTQVLARAFSRDATLRRPIQEAELEQVRLVHVLDSLNLLAYDRRNGCSADGTRGELLDDGSEQAAIRGVQALIIDVHRVHRVGRFLGTDSTV